MSTYIQLYYPRDVAMSAWTGLLSLPDLRQCLFSASFPSAANKQMFLLLPAALNLHELIEFKYTSFAAGPAFGTFVKQRLTWMI